MPELPTAWIANIPVLDKAMGQGQVNLHTSPPSGTYLRREGSIPANGNYFFGLHDDTSKEKTPYIFVQMIITERRRNPEGDLFLFQLDGEVKFYESKAALDKWRVAYLKGLKRDAKRRRMGG